MIDEEELEKQDPEESQTTYLPIGIGAGIVIGAGLGAAMGNIAIGVGAGIPIGVALGILLDWRRSRQ